MGKFIFQFIVLFLFWYTNAKSKRSFMTSSSWLIGIYMISALCGIFEFKLGGYQIPNDIEFWYPILAFTASILLFLLPFRMFHEEKVRTIVVPNKNILDLCSTIIIILSFYSIIFYSQTVIGIFSYGDLGYLRDARYSEGGEYFESGLMNTIASVSASLYVFALLLFFIYASLGVDPKRRKLLLLSSLSEPIHIMAFVGRDGVVFWLFSFVFFFLIFKPYLNKSYIKVNKKKIILLFIALMVPFLAITSGRFEDSDSGVGGSIISYMGHSFVYGPLFFNLENPPYIHLSSFPLIREIFNIPAPVTDMIEMGEWRSWCFSTFIVGLIRNFGYLVTYLIGIILIVVSLCTFGKPSKSLKFNDMIMSILYFQIIGQGVFYFRQYTRGGNLFIVMSIVLYFVFKQSCRTNTITLYRQ